MTRARFTPDAPGWLADPYEQYRLLRSEEPVHWSESLGHWVLTRYSDVVAVLKDPRFSATNRPPQRRWNQPTMMVTADPPEHARLRKPVSHRFAVWSVDELRPRIRDLVDSFLSAAEARGRMDVVTELAMPLPRTLIRQLMGVPAPAAPQDPAPIPKRERTPGPATASPRMAQRTELPSEQFFDDAIDRHRREIEDDLLNDLLVAEDGRRMSPEEVLDTAIILYTAGQETTAKLISNGLYQLLTHPDQLAKLRRSPKLMPSAAEELLRFDPPVQAISRKAREDVELGGRTIEAGQKALCVLAAANRDPEAFDRPDELDVEREENRHLAFGTGIHACLGGMLARAEVEIAIGTLIARFPKLRLATDDVEWEGSFIIRGVKSLPVELG